MKNTVIAVIVGLGLTLFGSQSIYAQSGGVTSNTTNAPDLSMLTNHTALVGWAFKHVQGVSATVTCGAQADDNQNLHFYSYTNQIKTLDGISAIVGADAWWVHVTSVTDWFNISASFYDTNNYNTIQVDQWNGNNSDTLFQGGSGGYPQANPYGGWALPSWSDQVPMMLAPYVKIPIAGAAMARLIIHDQYGNASGIDISADGSSIEFPSQYAGDGTLVLTTLVLDPTSGYYYTVQNAYNLGNNTPTPLTWVEAQIILSSSTDLVSYNNATSMDTYVWGWNGYGTIPLVIATYDSATPNVNLAVWSPNDGQYATSFVIEDQATGVRKTVIVPQGANSVNVDMPKGIFYIYPQGINLNTYTAPYGGSVGGGKG